MTKIVKYKENPFLDVQKIQSKKKQIVVGSSKAIVDPATGEIEGELSHIATYREVDDEEFVKFYTANIALTFDLSSAGNKVFQFLMRVMQVSAIKRDQVYLSTEIVDDFVEAHNVKLSHTTYYRGIKELTEKKVVARSTKANIFFVNPHLVFNGDRYAFTQAVRRKKVRRDPNTVDMLEGATDAERES